MIRGEKGVKGTKGGVRGWKGGDEGTRCERVEGMGKGRQAGVWGMEEGARGTEASVRGWKKREGDNVQVLGGRGLKVGAREGEEGVKGWKGRKRKGRKVWRRGWRCKGVERWQGVGREVKGREKESKGGKRGERVSS